MCKLHVADVVEEYLILEYHDQPLAIQTHAQHRLRECELAYGRVSLALD